jgi:thiamine-phosphate diphosphorylase
VIPRLHLVTDDAVLQNPRFLAAAVALIRKLQHDIALHLRGPRTSGRALHALATPLAAEAERAGALLVVNDRVDVAMAAGVSAVQLGERSLPVSRVRAQFPQIEQIGYSAHSAAAAAAAAQDGANFVLAGSIYATASHPGAQPAGLELLRACSRAGRMPVLAIGGIDASRVREVRDAGAYGVAVIRAVWQAADPVQAAAELHRMLRI